MTLGDTTTAAGPSAARPLRDVRGFWRVLLAVVAPLPMIAKGVYYLLSPVEGGAEFKDTVAAFAAHPQLADTLKWFDAVFVAGLVPATFAVAWAARRGAPRLTTAGALIALVGFLAGVSLLGGVLTPALLTVQHDLDIDAMAKLDQAWNNEPLIMVAGLLFIVGIVFGLGLLGAALWRSRVAPAWMGIALMAGGITHPFVPGHIGQGVGLLVTAAGFAGASVALLRMRNDEFDLPA
ncbi:proton-conducting transporter transmembrane domain-containing protein [Sphaerisporangium perillae]|uniref:proton-conducting transporter transmembrane domain-containing protein n=1 Tax=Sphaerisporangium perillae TaxID=2935860 RepID=UPI00200D19D7|nr:proton-conducting transporter membrane subunit [Sphaerisporangium perillae]